MNSSTFPGEHHVVFAKTPDTHLARSQGELESESEARGDQRMKTYETTWRCQKNEIEIKRQKKTGCEIRSLRAKEPWKWNSEANDERLEWSKHDLASLYYLIFWRLAVSFS